MRSPQEVQEILDKGTWFTAHLFRLMQKADHNNFARLAKCFPQEAREYLKWLNQHG